MFGGRDLTVETFASAIHNLGSLTGEINKPVVDRTGLSGRFDFQLEWSPEPGNIPPAPGEPVPDIKGPSFLEALREQLGLKLESTKECLRSVATLYFGSPPFAVGRTPRSSSLRRTSGGTHQVEALHHTADPRRADEGSAQASLA